MSERTHGIAQAWLSVTAQCNNRCRFCYYGHTLTSDHREIGLSTAKDVVQLLSQLGLEDCALVGGEPTLYSGLLELLSFASAQGVRPSLVTNGRRLKNLEFCKALRTAGVHRISISVEGVGEGTHDRAVGRTGAFADTAKGIANLRSLGFKFDVITTICRTNESELLDVVNWLIHLGLSDAVFNICTPSITGATFGEVLPPSQLASVLARLVEYRRQEIRLSVVTPFPPCLVDSADYHGGTCQMFHASGLAIDIDGTVLPCTHFSQAPLFSVLQGERVISAPEFEARWAESNQAFRSRLWRYPSDACIGCVQWEHCLGGCPLYWTAFDSTRSIQRRQASQP